MASELQDEFDFNDSDFDDGDEVDTDAGLILDEFGMGVSDIEDRKSESSESESYLNSFA